jgi:hypothetical protein
LNEIFKTKDIKKQRTDWLKKELDKNMDPNMSQSSLLLFITKLYEKSYSALDIILLLEDNTILPEMPKEKRYELLMSFKLFSKVEISLVSINFKFYF